MSTGKRYSEDQIITALQETEASPTRNQGLACPGQASRKSQSSGRSIGRRMARSQTRLSSKV